MPVFVSRKNELSMLTLQLDIWVLCSVLVVVVIHVCVVEIGLFVLPVPVFAVQRSFHLIIYVLNEFL